MSTLDLFAFERDAGEIVARLDKSRDAGAHPEDSIRTGIDDAEELRLVCRRNYLLRSRRKKFDVDSHIGIGQAVFFTNDGTNLY